MLSRIGSRLLGATTSALSAGALSAGASCRATKLPCQAASNAARTMAATPQDPLFPMARCDGKQPPTEYAELRKSCPVAPAHLWDGSKIWMLSRMAELRAALSDDRFSKVRTHQGFPELVEGAKAAVAGRSPTFVDMDRPEHTRHRGMYSPWFTKQSVESLRPSIKAKVEELIDGMEQKGGPLDLQEEFSLPLAFKVIYEMLGIPFTDYDFLSKNIAMRTSASYTARDAAAAQQELTDYMQRLVGEKEKRPQDDIISQVLKKHVKAGEISKDDLVAHAFLLLVAGNATVASMINLGVVELLGAPDQLAALKKDPEGKTPNMALEICRYHTASALALRRVALEDVSLGGQTIKKGQGIIALNMSANRDEGVFGDPDRFDIGCANAAEQVAYGDGTHRCIAEDLSLAELEEAFKGLFRRLPNLQLAVPESQLEWSDAKGDVGLKALPVKW